MMKKVILGLTSLVFVCISATSASAGYCIGKVTSLGVRANGEVYIVQTSGISYTTICSLIATYGNASTDVCKVWHQKLNASYLTGKDVAVLFDTQPSCTMAPGTPPVPVAGIENI